MASEWLALLAAVAVFGAVFAAFALGRGGKRSQSSAKGLHQIGQYVPPVVVELKYRNEAGIKMSRRVAVLRSLRHDDGRLYLLGFSKRHQPRTFRVDRIIGVATPDGEVVELREFLTGWLAIPPKMYATGKI